MLGALRRDDGFDVAGPPPRSGPRRRATARGPGLARPAGRRQSRRRCDLALVERLAAAAPSSPVPRPARRRRPGGRCRLAVAAGPGLFVRLRRQSGVAGRRRAASWSPSIPSEMPPCPPTLTASSPGAVSQRSSPPPRRQPSPAGRHPSPGGRTGWSPGRSAEACCGSPASWTGTGCAVPSTPGAPMTRPVDPRLPHRHVSDRHSARARRAPRSGATSSTTRRWTRPATHCRSRGRTGVPRPTADGRHRPCWRPTSTSTWRGRPSWPRNWCAERRPDLRGSGQPSPPLRRLWE